jgi:lipoprotein LprG
VTFAARKIGLVLVVLVVLAALLSLSACGEPEKLPPDQVIQKSAPAMQAVNSFHFALDTSKLAKPMPGLFITKAQGDVVKPDKLAGDVTAAYSGVPINIKVVVDGKSQYMTDPASGKWGAMSPAFNVVQFFDPTKGVSDILANVKNPTDDGTEAIDGVACYRLKATVPTSALKSLSPEVTATADLTTTLWVGSSDFLLRKVQMQGPIIQGEPTDIVRTITISNYNKEAKIETPVVGK